MNFVFFWRRHRNLYRFMRGFHFWGNKTLSIDIKIINRLPIQFIHRVWKPPKVRNLFFWILLNKIYKNICLYLGLMLILYQCIKVLGHIGTDRDSHHTGSGVPLCFSYVFFASRIDCKTDQKAVLHDNYFFTRP